jgi:hypothetical protein
LHSLLNELHTSNPQAPKLITSCKAALDQPDGLQRIIDLRNQMQNIGAVDNAPAFCAFRNAVMELSLKKAINDANAEGEWINMSPLSSI